MTAESSTSQYQEFEFQVQKDDPFTSVEKGLPDECPQVLMEKPGCSITLDPVTREIAKNGQVLTRLTKSPAKLLFALTKNPNEFVSENDLILQVWSDNYRRTSGLYNLVSRVRETFRNINEPLLAERIVTKRMTGYAWYSDSNL